MELTAEQIEVIRQTINSEGAKNGALQDDLVDHISCLVETEMDRGVAFENALQNILGGFAPAGGFRRLQFEIDYFSSLKNTIMKKLVSVIEASVLILLFVTTLLQGIRLQSNYSIPFVIELAFVNQFCICLIVVPLYWFKHYKLSLLEADGFNVSVKRIAFLIGFFCSEAFINAVFFKIMHMPGGNQLFIMASIMGIVYTPFYCLRKYRLSV